MTGGPRAMPDRWATVLPPRREPSMRAFGVVMAVALGAFAALAWWRWVAPGRLTPLVPVALAAAGMLILAWSAIAPASVRPFHDAWMRLGVAIGAAVAAVALTLMYLLVMTPVGLLMRAFGTDPLERRRPTGGNGHWHRAEPRGADRHETMS